MEEHMEIKKSTYVPEALKASKHVAEVFRKHDLKCLKCKGMVEDTIEKVAFNLISNNPNWKEKIRQTLQKHYTNVERGVWALN